MNKDIKEYYQTIANMVNWNGGPYALYKGWVLTDRPRANVISDHPYSAWYIGTGKEIYKDTLEDLLMAIDDAEN